MLRRFEADVDSHQGMWGLSLCRGSSSPNGGPRVCVCVFVSGLHLSTVSDLRCSLTVWQLLQWEENPRDVTSGPIIVNRPENDKISSYYSGFSAYEAKRGLRRQSSVRQLQDSKLRIPIFCRGVPTWTIKAPIAAPASNWRTIYATASRQRAQISALSLKPNSQC